MEMVKERLIKALEKCSILLDDNEDEVVNLDSFSYINAIIEIENEFDIEIPDNYLTENIFSSLSGLSEIITSLIG